MWSGRGNLVTIDRAWISLRYSRHGDLLCETHRDLGLCFHTAKGQHFHGPKELRFDAASLLALLGRFASALHPAILTLELIHRLLGHHVA